MEEMHINQNIEKGKIMRFPRQETEIMFSVDYKKQIFVQVFERIGRLFEGSYLDFIKKIDDQNIKDIYILLRKYQFFFTKMQLNRINIFDFTKSSDCLLQKVNEFYDKENKNDFMFELSILPKFKKDEIIIKIPDDLLKLNITIYFNSDINFQITFIDNSKVEIPNLDNTNILDSNIYKALNEIMGKVLDSFLNNYHKNIIQGLNKFLTYIENYFPEIEKKAYSKKIVQKDIWTQDEQDLLEEALLKHQNEKNIKEKFRKISAYVKTKSASECVSRFKMLSKLAKSSNDNQLEKEGKIDQEVEQDQSNKKNEIKLSEIKEDVTIKIFKPEKKPIKPLEQEINITNTFDLVDEIINQFDSVYQDIKLEKKISFDENKLGNEEEFKRTNGDDYDENYVLEEDEDLEDEEEEDLEEDDKTHNNKTFSDSNGNSVHAAKDISPLDIIFVQNLLKFGNKHQLSLMNATMAKIALVEICYINLFVCCSKCKKSGFEAKFFRLNKQFNIFSSNTYCPTCKNSMNIIFKSELIHMGNLKTAGTIFSQGVEIIELLPSTFMLNCFNCPDTYKKIRMNRGGIPQKEKACKSCGNELNFYIQSTNFITTVYNDFSFLENFTIEYFNRSNYVVEQNSSTSFVKQIKEGSPLPESGTCKHYRGSFRWFRFQCCSKPFPCDLCHDESNQHTAEYAKFIICGFCSHEQTSSNIECHKCWKSFHHSANAKGFWEGGKGCRNKALMSNKDSKKFKNTNKTISRKKRSEKNN